MDDPVKPTSPFGTIPDVSSLDAYKSTETAPPSVPQEVADQAAFAEELLGRPMPTPTPSLPRGEIPNLTTVYDKPSQFDIRERPVDTLARFKKNIYDAVLGDDDTAETNLQYARWKEERRVQKEKDKVALAQALQYVNENGLAEIDQEKAKNVVRLSLATGMDPQQVLENYDYVNDIAKEVQPNWLAMAKRYPAVSEWLLNPVHMRLAEEDYPTLGVMERWFTGSWGPEFNPRTGEYDSVAPLGPALALKSFKGAFNQMRQTQAEMFGDKRAIMEVTTAQEAETLEAGAQGIGDKLLQGMFNIVGYGAADAVAGRIPGAIVGGVIGSVAGPGGTLAGMAIGQQVGSFMFNIFTTAGQMKTAIREDLASRGNALTEDEMDGLAWGGAMAFSAFATYGGDKLLKGLGLGVNATGAKVASKISPDVKAWFAKKFVEETKTKLVDTLPRPWLGTWVVDAVKANAHAGFMFAGMSASQAATIEAANLKATGRLDDFGWQRVWDATWQGARQGFVDFAILSAVGATRGFVRKSQEYAKAVQNLKALDDFADAYANSKVGNNSPQTLEVLVGEMARRMPDRGVVYLTTDVVGRLAEKINIPVDELYERLSGLPRDQWADHTGMVRVPLDRYGKEIAARKLQGDVVHDVSFDGVRTVWEVQDEQNALLTEAASQFIEGDKPALVVAQILEKAFMGQGESKALAKANAHIWAWWMAQRSIEGRAVFGKDFHALDFLRQTGLQLRSSLPHLAADGSNTVVYPTQMQLGSERSVEGAKATLSETQKERDLKTAKVLAYWRDKYAKGRMEILPGDWTKGISPDDLFAKGMWKTIAGDTAAEEWSFLYNHVKLKSDQETFGLKVRSENGEVLVYTPKKNTSLPDPISVPSKAFERVSFPTLIQGAIDGKYADSFVIMNLGIDPTTARREFQQGSGWWTSTMDFVREAYQAYGARTAGTSEEVHPKKRGHMLALYERSLMETSRGVRSHNRTITLFHGYSQTNAIFHEMTHAAMDLWTDMVLQMGDKVPLAMERRYLAILEWMGYPVRTESGEYLSAYEGAVMRNMVTLARSHQFYGAEGKGPVVPYPVFGHLTAAEPHQYEKGLEDIRKFLTPKAQAQLQLLINAQTGEEKLAYSFSEMIKLGKLPHNVPESVRTGWDIISNLSRARPFDLVAGTEAGFEKGYNRSHDLQATAYGMNVKTEKGKAHEEGYGNRDKIVQAMGAFFVADTALENAMQEIQPMLRWKGNTKESVPGKAKTPEDIIAKKMSGMGADFVVGREFSSVADAVMKGNKTFSEILIDVEKRVEAKRARFEQIKERVDLVEEVQKLDGELKALDIWVGELRKFAATEQAKQFGPKPKEVAPAAPAKPKMEIDPMLLMGTLPLEAKEEARLHLLEMLRKARAPIEGDPSGKARLREQISAEQERIRGDVRAELMESPAFKALLAISGRIDHLDPGLQKALTDLKASGKDIRFNREEFRKTYGIDVERKLPHVLFAEKGKAAFSLDEISNLFGLSKEELIGRAVEFGHITKFVEREVQDRMLQKYGEMVFNPDTMNDMALGEVFRTSAAINQGIEQLRYLARLIGKDDFNDRAMTVSWEQLLKQATENGVDQDQVRRMNPDAIARMIQTAWKKAFAAAQTDNLEEAFNQKQRQLWLSALYLAAREKREKLDAIRYRLEGRANTKTYRAELGKASSSDPTNKYAHTVREAHDAILEAIGFRVPDIEAGEPNLRSQVADKVLALLDYAKAKQVMLDFEPAEVAALAADIAKRVVPEQVEAGGRLKEWNFLTVRQAELIDRVVKQLYHFAKLQNNIRLGGQDFEVKVMTARLLSDAKARNLKDQGLGVISTHGERRPTLTDRKLWEAFDAELTETETVLRQISPYLADTIFNEFREARAMRNRLAASVLKWWHDNYIRDIPEEIRKHSKEEVKLSQYGLRLPDGMADNADRMTLYMIALNMGDAGARDRLLRGYGWSESSVVTMLSKTLAPEEWKFLQSTWDFFEQNLWPHVKAKTERQKGLPLKKEKAAKIVLDDGTEIRGGYFPVKINEDFTTDKLSQTDGDLGQYYKPDYSRAAPNTFKGHTIERVKGTPEMTINLNWNLLSSHLVQVVHDIAFDDFVQNVGRMFSNKEFMDTMTRYLGYERAKHLNPWLWSVANGYVDAIPRHQRLIAKWLEGLRDKFVVGTIGHSIGVAVADLTNPLVATAVGRVRVSSLGLATSELISAFTNGTLNDLYQQFSDASPVIFQRSNHWTMKIRGEMAEPTRRSALPDAVASVRDRISESAFRLQEFVDKYTSMVIWKAALRDAQDKGIFDPKERVRYADRIVEDVLPSLEKMSQAPLIRNHSFWGSMLVFQGYFNKLYNVARQDFHEDVYLPYRKNATHDWQAKGELARGIVGYTMSTMAMLTIAQTVAEWMSGRGQEDDESLGAYFVRRTISAPFALVPFGMLPGEWIGAKITGKKRMPGGPTKSVFSIRTAPPLALIETITRDLVQVAGGGGKDIGTDERIWSAIELLLYANRLPARQWRRSGEYLTDWMNGEQNPKGPGDFLSGVAYGARKHQPSNLFRYVGRSW